MTSLQGKKVAILVTDGFEQSELLEPRKALDEAGATTQVVSPVDRKVKGWNHKEWGNEVPVDIPLKSAKADEFDALLLPGGVMNPDHLRMQPEAVAFVKRFTDGRQTGGGYLSRPLDSDRSRRGAGTYHDVLAVAENGPEKCWSQLGRQGSSHRQKTSHQP
jgi:Putative intracellular protease/amidase